MNVEQIQQDTQSLWTEIENILEYYHSIACQCAFPRYRQYVSIDCTDTGKSFYISETEGFIGASAKYFDILNNTGYSADYVCKKCKSVYGYGWADFSIHVSRSYLKITEQKVKDIGAAPVTPIPMFVGAFGHSVPRDMFVKTDLDSLVKYLKEMQSN